MSSSDNSSTAAVATSAATAAAKSEIKYIFGDYLLFPQRRQLLAGSKVVELGSRALDVLITLVEAEGTLVSKGELLRRVWPRTTVKEENIPVQIASIRKMLGNSCGLLKTDAGRGYRFTGAVRIATPPEISIATSWDRSVVQMAAAARTNLPAAVSSLLGRESEVAELLELLATHRLVTLTGPGGIGKTQLALEVARRALPDFADGAGLVEFGSLTDPDLVPNAIARVFGIGLDPQQCAVDQVIAVLCRKHILLVLDNCEHVVDFATHVVERLLHEAPRLHILTTSQEILAADGECAYRVSPLTVPARNVESAALAMEHSAVQLFVARAQAADRAFSLNDHTAKAVSQVCRRLDGIPLAIELAAACVTTTSVEMLANGIDNCFRLLTGGRRTALKRHQTLGAMFDWSYGLLDPVERLVLRRLAIFVGSFTLDDALAVAADTDAERVQTVDYVTRLIKKSLVTLDTREPFPRFRLLDTTRTYAVKKLAESGELDLIARRHAEYFRQLLERMHEAWWSGLTTKAAAQYAPEISAALHWAFEHEGRSELGVALATACVPLWTHLSILGPCFNRSDQRMRQEMLLQAALAHSLIWGEGAVGAIWSAAKRALEIAEQLGDTECQLRALYFQWAHLLLARDYRACLPVAEQFKAIAERKGDHTLVISSERIIGTTLHYLGHLVKARATLEDVLRKSSSSMPVRFSLDDRVAALAQLARVLWLQGFPSRAARIAATAIDEAETLDHANSLCFAICSGGCSVAASAGDLSAADNYTARLIECADEHGLEVWRTYGRAFKHWIATRRGDDVAGMLPVEGAFDDSENTRVELHHPIFVEAMSDACAAAGRPDDGLALIQRMVDKMSSAGSNWCVAELLRLRGEFLLRHHGPAAASVAEKDFLSAFDLSRLHGARSWQLRSAISLARLWQARGQSAKALDLLAPVFGWFTEGFETADLVAAKTLVEKLTNSAGDRGRAVSAITWH